MKIKKIAMAAVFALGGLFAAHTSEGAVVVGTEDFESYTAGAWIVENAPDANPKLYINGANGGLQSAAIVDDGGTNQQLQLSLNMQSMWQAGITFEYGASNNVSQNIDDYTMQFDLQMSEASVSNLLANCSLFFVIRNVDDTTEGNRYPISSSEVTSAVAGGVFTLGLDRTNILASGCSVPMDGSATNWQVQIRVDSNSGTNDQPIIIVVDDMVATYTEPPFLNTIWLPTGLTTNDPTISATVHDGTKEVDSLMLYVDGGLVASNSYAGGSTTSTISYDWIGAPGGIHTGTVVVAAADAYAETNTWTFQVPVEAPAPATNILQLYSFNFSGYADPLDPVNEEPYLNAIYQQSVSNGVLGAAPSLGGNIWNNLKFENAWNVPDPYDYTLVDSYGNSDTNTPCKFRVSSTHAIGSYWNVPWTWYWDLNNFIANTFTDNSMWPVWLGSGGSDAPFATDIDLYIDGLHPTGKYDLYMYFTSNQETITNKTTYTVVEGSAPFPAATLTSSWDPFLPIYGGSPTNYAEGTNYCVITSVSPTAGGRITVNVSGLNKAGGICAMQIAMRGDGVPIGPTINPNIQSMTMNGGMATLMFDSESGFTYTVNSKSNLSDASWSAVTNITGAGATTSAEVPATSDVGFFMIEGN